LDVHLLVSSGEGFGIPILEAQACGCPVIVGDWTAMSELCFAGRMIDKKDAFKQYTNLSSWQYRPIPRAIDLALEAEYQKPSKRERAVRMAQEYDADYLIENYWKPILGKIEEDARAGAL
jgi:glycosyltransferase involved in cell wall biosynthesis